MNYILFSFIFALVFNYLCWGLKPPIIGFHGMSDKRPNSAKQDIMVEKTLSLTHADFDLASGAEFQQKISIACPVTGWLTDVSLSLQIVTAEGKNMVIVFDPTEEHQHSARDKDTYNSYMSEFAQELLAPNNDMFVFSRMPLWIRSHASDPNDSLMYAERNYMLPVHQGMDFEGVVYGATTADATTMQISINVTARIIVAALPYWNYDLSDGFNTQGSDYLIALDWEADDSNVPYVFQMPCNGRIGNVRMTKWEGVSEAHTLVTFGKNPNFKLEHDSIEALADDNYEVRHSGPYSVGVVASYFSGTGPVTQTTSYFSNIMFVDKGEPLYIHSHHEEAVEAGYFILQFTFIPDHDSIYTESFKYQEDTDIDADTTLAGVVIPFDVFIENPYVFVSASAGASQFVGSVRLIGVKRLLIEVPAGGRVGFNEFHGVSGMARMTGAVLGQMDIAMSANGVFSERQEFDVYDYFEAYSFIYLQIEVFAGTITNLMAGIDLKGKVRGKSSRFGNNILDGTVILREESLEDGMGIDL